jgi:hypothetical protein
VFLEGGCQPTLGCFVVAGFVRASSPTAERDGITRGIRIDAGSEATAGSYLAAWLGHVKARVRARTHQGYEGLVHLYALPHLGEIALEALQPLDIQDVYARLLEREPPLSAGTVLNLHLVLHNAFG